jgi:dipeptidyl aminopeptidase/acylaminoacyl peptidase
MERVWPWVVLAAAVVAASATNVANAASAMGKAGAAEPSRRLRFDADEGTWMSLDVAPDGRGLVFELLGDLYSLPLEGGQAARLTSGTAFDAQPRYSPDGRSIVLVSDRGGSENLWLLEGGALTQLTHEREVFFVSPEWAPDGRSIVVSKSTKTLGHEREYQLFEYGLAQPAIGRQLTGLVEPSPGAVLGAAFGEDPQEIFAAFETSPGWPSIGSWQIGAIDARSGKLRQRTFELTSAMRPVLSPDGRLLVYATQWEERTGYKLVDVETHEQRWLVPDVDLSADDETAPRRDLLPGAAFTPDGAVLIVSYHGKIWRVRIADGVASQIPFTAAVDVELAPRAQFEYRVDSERVRVRRIEQPQLSPDGRHIAFSALDRIWIRDLGGSAAPVQVSEGSHGAFFPTWSPDGRFLAFVTWDDLEGGHVWRVRADRKSRPERLSSRSAFYEKLAYSPDGSRLIAARGVRLDRAGFYAEVRYKGRGQSNELVWMPSEGGDFTRITFINAMPRWASAHYGVPHFGPDSGVLYFNDPVDGLVAVAWDGTDRRTILRVEGQADLADGLVPADEIMISPDGRRTAALLNGQIWLLELPAAHVEPPKVVLPSQSPALRARRLSREGGDFVRWRPDGRALAWSLGSSFFELEVDGATATAPRRRDVPLSVAADRPRGAILFRGARVITMREDEVIERGDVLVVDERIAAVGPSGTVRVPAGARILDVAGKTVLPGYVDVHWHGDMPWGVHRTQVWENLAAIAYGVTAIRDPQPTTMDILTYADRRAATGERGPRIFSTGRGIFRSDDIRSADDARAVARRLAELYRTETAKDYMVNADRGVRRWMADAAREYRLTLTAESNSDFKYSLLRIFDGYGGQAHMPTATPYHRDVATLIAASGITIDETTGRPTPLAGTTASSYMLGTFVQDRVLHVTDAAARAKVRRFLPQLEIDYLAGQAQDPPKGEYRALQLSQSLLAILRSGGNIALGTHGAMQGLGAHWILWTLVESGLTPHEALRIATLSGARAIGHGRDFGSIEPGRLADLQVLDGNPLSDIRESLSIRYVMVNGRVYAAESLDEIWPRAQPLEPQWWQAN